MPLRSSWPPAATARAASQVHRLACALAIIAFAANATCAEPTYKPGGVYPSRSVRLIVPHAPGEATDTIARLMAPALSESLGQPVIVDNRAGENGVTGTDLAAKSGNQGYTLLMADTAFAASVGRSRLPYDRAKDFIPITLVASRASGWYGLFAPAGTQWNIVTHLADHVAKALARDDVKQQLAAVGATGVGSAPEGFQAFVTNEIAKSAKTGLQ
ncbi:MAG TPA: tripartite tricarboxylate transporter substrate-binding protein [Burkholderiales bacterium]|nr:tripartite tricarboxylate transporter substrate-binding protein [Burkholderiales bacterium]